MRFKSFSTIMFLIVLLVAWALPALAAVTTDTEIVTIQEGRSKRESFSTILDKQHAVQFKSSYGAGAKNGATVTAVEHGDGNVHTTTLVFGNTPITVRDTEQGGGVKVYDFPAGRILILGAVGNMQFATTSVLADTLNAGVSCRWGSAQSHRPTLRWPRLNRICCPSLRLHPVLPSTC